MASAFFRFGMLVAALSCLLVHVNAIKSSGCGKPLAKGIRTGQTGSSNKLSITSNGVMRSYLLHIPNGYVPTNAHGLIFSFHGRTATGAQ